MKMSDATVTRQEAEPEALDEHWQAAIDDEGANRTDQSHQTKAQARA